MFGQHQAIPVRRGDLQGSGDQLGTLGLFTVEALIDGDHSCVLDDRPCEHSALLLANPKLGRENHVHAVSRVYEPGLTP